MGRRWWVVGVVMMSAMVLLSACSSDDSSSTPDSVPSDEKVVLEAYGVAPSTSEDLARAATIVQQRLRALGVHDASVTVKGQQLIATGAGVGEAAPKALQPGRLEFRPVLTLLPPETQPGASVDPEPDDTVLPSRNVNGDGTRYEVGPVALTGDGVASAKAQDVGGDQGWQVVLGVTPTGRDAFNRLAIDLYPKQPPQNAVAIVLDGVVQSAPVFAAADFTGDVAISGSFTEAEAKQLATILSSGSVPVPLRIAG